jgi:hypothetical protein
MSTGRSTTFWPSGHSSGGRRRNALAYRITVRRSVAAAVERFDAATRRYWDVCLQEIALNPMPRYGAYVERDAPIRGFPSRTYNYEIYEEVSIAGEVLYVFVAEFFPHYLPIYAIDEANREVELFYLRNNPWV